MRQTTHTRPRLLRIALLTGLMLAACLRVTVSVGAVKARRTIQSWGEALLSGKQDLLTLPVRKITERLEGPNLAKLSQVGLDAKAASDLLGNPAFKQLASSLALMPDLKPFVRNGDSIKSCKRQQGKTFRVWVISKSI
jgi:hypothetical protein